MGDVAMPTHEREQPHDTHEIPGVSFGTSRLTGRAARRGLDAAEGGLGAGC
jgi:hypothetical protein